MFAKAIHVCEHTFEGVRRRELPGATFECAPSEFETLRRFGAAKAVSTDPLDHDGDGRPGGSKPGRRRRHAPEPAETEADDVVPEVAADETGDLLD